MTQVTPFIDHSCLQGDVMPTVMGLCPPNTAELLCQRPLVHFNHHSSEFTIWDGRFIIVLFNPDSKDAFSHSLFCGRIFVVDSGFFFVFFLSDRWSSDQLLADCDL